MLTTLAIVQAPAWATGRGAAVGESVLGRRLGGKSLLEWVVRRVTDAARLDGVIVTLAEGPEADLFARLVPLDVPVHVSAAPDPLSRLVDAVDRFPADAVVRVSVDNPFVDPALIDRLVTTSHEHPGCDYIGYCLGDGRPVVRSRMGVVAEWCRSRTLRKANRSATDPQDRCDPTRYVYSHPERFSLRLIPLPEPLDRDDLRLIISGEDDWEHAQQIYDALGPEDLEWHRIAGLLDHQPRLRAQMALLNRAESEVPR